MATNQTHSSADSPTHPLLDKLPEISAAAEGAFAYSALDEDADDDPFHRHVLFGARQIFGVAGLRAAQVAEAALEAVPDDGQRTNDADDAGCGD